MPILGGCVSFAHHDAYLVSRTRTLNIDVPTGHWGWGPCGPAEIAGQYTVVLPEAPADQKEYAYSVLTITPQKDRDGREVSFDAGYVSVDRAKNKVVVALHTPQGDFWANGTYRLY